MKNLIQFLPSLALSGLMGLTVGCASSSGPAPNTQANVAEAEAPLAIALKRWATGDDVILALGKPKKIEQVKDNPAAELWTYSRVVDRNVRMIEPTTQTVPVFDGTNRVTGMVDIEVPLTQMQEVEVEEVLVLIMDHDQLSDWNFSYRHVENQPF